MFARSSTVLAVLFVFAASATLAHAGGVPPAAPKQQTSASTSPPPPVRTGPGEANNGRNQGSTGSTVVNGMATVPEDIMINLDVD